MNYYGINTLNEWTEIGAPYEVIDVLTDEMEEIVRFILGNEIPAIAKPKRKQQGAAFNKQLF